MSYAEIRDEVSQRLKGQTVDDNGEPFDLKFWFDTQMEKYEYFTRKYNQEERDRMALEKGPLPKQQR